MSISGSCAVCTIRSNVVAFGTPFHASPRSSAWSSRQTCSWTSRPVLQAAASSFRGCRVVNNAKSHQRASELQRVVPRAMFSGGGILGVGASEVVVIVAVGWLLLGPDKLFSLSKEAGKFLGQLRKTADEAQGTFKEALDLDAMAAEAKAIKMELEAATTGTTTPKVSLSEADSLSQAISPNQAETASAQAESTTMSTASPDVAVAETSPPSSEAGAEAAAVTETSPLSSEAEAQAGGSSAFLDQLRRMSDPNQVAPSEVPDLAVDVEKLEVERLEREYMEAKQKLDERRAQAKLDESNDINSGVEGR